jgi:Mrp family chromosome partitioning ATPase
VAGLPGLRLLASGALPPQPYVLLGGARTAALLDELVQVADVVVLDSPPLAVADAARLAAQVDGVLLVVRPGATDAEALLAAADQLERAGARMLGAVLNRVPRMAGFYPRAYTAAAKRDRGPEMGERQPAFGEGQAGD